MKYKTNTQGFDIIVDDEDYHLLEKHNYCVYDQKYQTLVRKRTSKDVGRAYYISLKSEVLNYSKPFARIINLNQNAFDCRKENLLIISADKPKPRSRHKFVKGFVWVKNSRKWMARINNDYLGLFSNWLDAAEAYRKAELAKYKSLARTEEQYQADLVRFEKNLYEEEL